MNINNKLFMNCLCFLSCQLMYAQSVSVEQAEHMANTFWVSRTANQEIKKAKKVTLIGKKQQPAMYAFSRDSSWVLIAADERITPILAFSDENTSEFPSDKEMPPAIKDLLEWYEYQIEYIRDSTDITEKSSGWISHRDDPGIGLLTPVPPLLTHNGVNNAWGQWENNSGPYVNSIFNKSYNKFCPLLDGCSQHSPAGCVAVAISQVMWYWQWPNAAVVGDGYGNYLLREYDWSLMPTHLYNYSPDNEVDMIASLLHDVGLSVNIDYDCYESGANSALIPAALNKFNYLADEMIFRNSYTNNQWLQLLKDELDRGRPVLYGGQFTNNKGHQFVIDGYMYDNHFHVNLGGNGEYIGYFLLDSISDGLKYYTINQSAILHIHPNYPTCSDIMVQPSESWQPNFSKFNGGGMTIGNRTIASNHKGVIFSGDYVRLTNGFHISAGAEVRIGIRDIACDVPLLLNSAPTSTERVARSAKAGYTHTKKSLSLSPNPVSDILYIRSSEALKQVRIYNLNGQCLLQTTKTEINVSALPAGLYILIAQTVTDDTLQSKFVKL